MNIHSRIRRIAAVIALCALVATGTATWLTSTPAAAEATEKSKEPEKPKEKKISKGKQSLSGKLNLNTATSEQLQMLPGVGPSKADRVVAWRTKNGNFKRVADLRKVKGFGYKTLKKLESYLDVKGQNTLTAK